MSECLIRSARLEDSGEIAEIHAAGWRASYRGQIPETVLDGPLIEEFVASWRRRLITAPSCHMVLVAVERDTNRIMGFASAGQSRSRTMGPDGELYTLYIDPSLWRQRLGVRLISAAATRLQLFGKRQLLVWALAGNSAARSFYERLGGELIGERVERVGGVSLPEVGYGWRDIHDLLDCCRERLALQ